ncbi:MAG: hypothetical protein HGA54_01465 [Actinobacteria bacterium]|nr:hypothetical protein [Actinomycetota bacterium]
MTHGHGHEHARVAHEHDEHVESCTCGCHDHAGHDYEGRNHANEDRHHHHAPVGDFLELTTHDISLVASYRLTLADELEAARDTMAGRIASLGSAVEEAGGFIGHIKCFVKTPGAGYKISLTNAVDGPVCEAAPITSTVAEGVAIVFGLEEGSFEVLVRMHLM